MTLAQKLTALLASNPGLIQNAGRRISEAGASEEPVMRAIFASVLVDENNDIVAMAKGGQLVDINGAPFVLNSFGVSLADSNLFVTQDDSVDVVVTVTKTSGLAETVALTISGLPTGVTGEFDPSSVSSNGGTSTLTLSAADDAPIVESDAFTVTATGSVVRTATGTVSTLEA